MAATKWRERRRRLEKITGGLLAAAMILQLSAGGLSVAFAAEHEESEPLEAAGTSAAAPLLQGEEDTSPLQEEDAPLVQEGADIPGAGILNDESEQAGDSDDAVVPVAEPEPEPEPVYEEPQSADSDNLITNGDFSQESEGWETHVDAASLELRDNAAVFHITGGAADWGQSLSAACPMIPSWAIRTSTRTSSSCSPSCPFPRVLLTTTAEPQLTE